MITETKENQTQTSLKNFKPKINLNHNIYLRFITRCCERNILQRHEKCQFYAFGDGATGLDKAKY